MIDQETLRAMFAYEEAGTLRRQVITHPNQKPYPWWMNDQGYWCGTINKKNYRLHRLIFLYHHGDLPDVIDHIDRDRANNRIENLRLATPAQNLQNSLVRRDCISGLKGAFFRSRDAGKPKPWTSKININGKVISLGYYATAQEAHDAYCKAAKDHYGEYFFDTAVANQMADLARA